MLQENIHIVDNVADCRKLECVCVFKALSLAFYYSFRANVLLLLIYTLTRLVPHRAFACI